jgi:hypothetical protein
MKIRAGGAFHHRNPAGRADRRCRAGVAELPEGDHHVGADHQHGGAGGEPVHAVGQVHPVGGGRDDQEHPDQEQQQRQGGAGERADERDAPEGVGEIPGADGEADRGQCLPAELGGLGEAEAALVADLEVVVDEADQAEGDHGDDHQQAARGEADVDQQVGHAVAGHRAEDHHRAAHGRGAALGLVGVGQVDLDELAEVVPTEAPDGQRRADQPNGQGDRRGDQDADH